jgi:hypothetical protein
METMETRKKTLHALQVASYSGHKTLEMLADARAGVSA